MQVSEVLMEAGALSGASGLLRAHFGEQRALLIADPNTFRAAGSEVRQRFEAAGQPVELLLLDDPALYAEQRFVERLEGWLAEHAGVPVAVGSGTLNDLTKLAAHRTGRPYMAVATAASMDGYTAFGASITYRGNKQTFPCPPPRVVLADLDVLSAAPPELGAAGYADLQAKVTAGADWILADALGEEPLHPEAWATVQHPLRAALADPAGVRAGDPEAIRRLMEGLLAGGTAMQLTQTSRPASGAEHQFSHLWDMEGHKHQGKAPAHGFKVGIATAAVAELYERLLEKPLENLDVEGAVAAWPAWEETEAEIRRLCPVADVARIALQEAGAKWPDRSQLRAHLERVREAWPGLRGRLKEQLLPADELRRRLQEVGAPSQPEEIGISQERLAASFRPAYYLRRRYTALDLALRIGVLG